ncbi:MAG: thioesterase family protein [Acidimicrobiales bacterium]
MPLEPGLVAAAEHVVGPADLATALGSGTVEVLSTPRLLAWVEAACMRALDGHLESGETSVGMRAQFDHVAPSVVGATVHATTELERVDGRRLTFLVTAADARGEIANGRLTRVIVDSDRFIERARAEPDS